MNSLLASLLVTWAAVVSADHPDVRPEAPLLTPTGCTSLHCHILSHLPEVVGCCVVPEDRSTALADFAEKLVEKCSSSLHSLDSCIAEATTSLLGDACLCINPSDLSESLRSAMKNSVMPALSEGLSHGSAYPNTPGGNRVVDMLSKNKENADRIVYDCTDRRLQGDLCSSWSGGSITSGNTRCRDGHYCGSHGYRYEWCYTDYSNNWEYCCSGPCGYNGENYRWCKSGSTWEYCGSYPAGEGTKNILGMSCMSHHPCGKHGYYNYYYWCEYDHSGNWHYCCAPGQSCSGGNCYINDQGNSERSCVN